MYISPGFIDMHLHGGAGHDFADGNPDAVSEIACYHCKHGSTTIFPTTLSASYENIVKSLSAIKYAINSGNIVSNIGGVHLEGPYLSPGKAGAINPGNMRLPRADDFENYEKIKKKCSQ